MNIHALRDILSGVYSINPMQIPYYEYLLSGLRNGITFESDQKELEEFKSFVQDAMVGRTTSASGSTPQATKIAVHNQKGVILRDSMGCGHVGTREVGNRMLQYDADEDVMAQVIFLNTPGGDSRAFEEIRDAKAKCNKPVYAFVDVMCCSAGVHIASFCDEIFSHRDTDIIGSIGTYAEYGGFKNGDKDGEGRIRYRVYATKSDKKNAEFEALVQDGNTELVEVMANKYRDRFVDDVLANRPNATEEGQCHGDTWDASEVVGTLIDGIKTWEELIDHIVETHESTNSSSSTSSAAHSNNKNNTKMEKYALLVAFMATAGLQDLELDADGALSLNDEQLTAVNAALGTYNSIDVDALEAERDAALAAQQTAIDDLATANARIEELEDEDGAQSSTVKKKLDTTTTVVSTDKQAMDDAKALVAAHTAQK